MVKGSVILLLSIKTSFFGASAYAQGESELEPMVVVETRSPVPLSEASPWVTRISQEDLESRQSLQSFGCVALRPWDGE